ncbi:FAD-binding protein [Tessaracoccus caeni]|uniref:FAD-binding protein n=1 Tax=Tessaracoccus caeni TaxID=3031239 RepID=UPI0023DBB8C5|nr:FAD-binding protein [Tessaracoccus caeni]MDF1487119.1 FAD-binding protein [Tessaracoccus caeni]
MAVTNWAGNVTFTPHDVLVPRTLEDAQAMVAGARRIRALGTGHSFNPIADSDALISMHAVDLPFSLDEQARTVTVPGAVPYGAVAGFLQEQGWALHNLGSLPHISVAGAIATGTHGSGDGNGVLATAVRGIERIGPDGDLSWVRAGEPDFEGSVVALGALGITTRLELAIEPTYDITQHIYTDLLWDRFLDEFDDVMSAAYSVSVLGRWSEPTLSTLWLKCRNDDATPTASRFGAALQAPRVGALPDGGSPDDNLTPIGTRGSWATRLAHFRFDRAPSAGGDELQSEYFVPRDQAVEALRAIRALADRIDPVLHVSEFRTFTGDHLWLSGGEGGACLGIHFTWQKRPDDVVRVLPEIEAALAPFSPRAHWGKLCSDVFDQAAAYRRVPDFLDLVDRVDPAGTFRCPHLEHALGYGRRTD